MQKVFLTYDFKNKDLIDRALTHSSAVENPADNNERLEFLGDRVLGLVIADLLLKKYVDVKEGDVAKKHSLLVSRQSLAEVGKAQGIDNLMKVSNSIDINNADKIIADCVEAVIGAVFLDAGFNVCYDLISSAWEDLFENVDGYVSDVKSLLQEKTQDVYKSLPVYNLLSRSGVEHSPLFEVEVQILNEAGKILFVERAVAGSKKKAEQAAAKKMLEVIK